MRGLAETGPLEGFPVSLLKIRQRSSPNLGDLPLRWTAAREQIQPAGFRGETTFGKVPQNSIPFLPRIDAGQESSVLYFSAGLGQTEAGLHADRLLTPKPS